MPELQVGLSKGSLTGLKAVVTGAAQGLGLGIAEQLARDGAHVTIADIQLDKARTAAKALCERGLNVAAGGLDVAQSAEVERFFAAFARDHGRLDILVNNAGVGQ